ncbi:hypothetical protein WMF20_00950 [Sorangium sp. So ce834]|uniref:hypothetical protein n=1 Tax=Sorangium sp. So ce834 TaxID=3133321 RepID=UPI003F6168FA
MVAHAGKALKQALVHLLLGDLGIARRGELGAQTGSALGIEVDGGRQAARRVEGLDGREDVGPSRAYPDRTPL